MYNMIYDIRIGNYKLAMVEQVTITKSVEKLSDTAIITLPGTAYNKALEIEDKIKRGDSVTIQLGYNKTLVTEFEGFVDKIKNDGGSLTIEIEDNLFAYKESIPDEEFKNESVRNIIAYLHTYIKGYSLACDYDFSYDSFVISNATAYDVLKKIQEEAKPNVYVKNKTLHIHPQYIETFGRVIYDFAINIDAEGTELTYKRAEDRKILVVAEGKDSNGKVVRAEYGTTGGDKITVSIPGVSRKETLTQLAKEAHTQKVYEGFEGSIVGWLVPYCDAGYEATIRDHEYEYKNGTYYVTEVVVEFSESGGKRTVKLGKKIK